MIGTFTVGQLNQTKNLDRKPLPPRARSNILNFGGPNNRSRQIELHSPQTHFLQYFSSEGLIIIELKLISLVFQFFPSPQRARFLKCGLLTRFWQYFYQTGRATTDQSEETKLSQIHLSLPFLRIRNAIDNRKSLINTRSIPHYPPPAHRIPQPLKPSLQLYKQESTPFSHYQLQFMRKIVYSVEGNIGSGKSVLLQSLLHRLPTLKLAPQPVAHWQAISKYNLLDQYYQDPPRWAYTFQTYAILTRMSELRKIINLSLPKGSAILAERSVVADKLIFARLLRNLGSLTEMEYQVYLKFYSELEALMEPAPIHRHLYLKTSPKKCLQRMAKRGRAEESKVSLDYLQKIHNLHEEWLGSGELIIDGQVQFQDGENIQHIVEQVRGWINPK